MKAKLSGEMKTLAQRVASGTVWLEWPKLPRVPARRCRALAPRGGLRAVGAYLGTACLEGPCFASSCGNALYVPLKSFAAYSFGHNIHICEVYQLQKTQSSSRPQLNASLMCKGNACNTVITKKSKKLLLRAQSIMDSGRISTFKNVNAQGFPSLYQERLSILFHLDLSTLLTTKFSDLID